MKAKSPMQRRRSLLWIVGAAFLLMAGIALWRVLALRELAIEAEQARLKEYVDEQVMAWEDALLRDLQDRLDAAASDPERVAGLQRNWRRHRWFDSLFVWQPAAPEREERMLFPLMSAPDADVRLRFSPCLKNADRLTMRGAPLDEVAAAWVYGCRSEDENVRLVAATRAAIRLVGANRVDDAVFALSVANIPDNVSLRNAAAQGVSPFRLTTWRTLRIQLLLRTGAIEEALDLAIRLGEQVADLEAPDLAAVSLHMRELVSQLEQHERLEEANALRVRFARADRRKHAYEEVQRRLLHERVTPDMLPASRLVFDVYSDQPFLLYYGWSGGVGVALALEQEPLIEDFLRNRMRKMQGSISLTEARTDRWIAGARTGGRCALTVPFNRTLTHVAVCVRERPMDAAVAGINEQWLVPLGIILACMGIGLAALVALDRAARHEYDLLDRQRAFSTRVTHELKTPLAGIRVMAENLEFGAFRDEAHRKEMAHRIVAEADQLTRRVEEVLAVAKQRSIPSPEPFDPEEVLLIAIDEWGPRLADAGVALHAELAPTDAVMGDSGAMRDAVACLLDNALKYRKDGRSDAQVWLDLAQVGRIVTIAVKDNGLGVPRGMRRRIFDRFVRVEGPHRGMAGGHGLGLNQVKEIVEAHNGAVTCSEGVDGGTQFTLKLPAHIPKRR